MAVAKNSSSSSSASPFSSIYDLRSDIKLHLTLVGFPQAYQPPFAIPFCPNHNVVAVSNNPDRNISVFSVIDPVVLTGYRGFPVKPFSDAKITAVFLKIASTLRHIPNKFHGIYVYIKNSVINPKFQGALIAVVFGGSLLSSRVAQAKDLGTHGPLFEVTEPSLLETIKQRLSEMEAEGELDVMKKEMQDRTKAYVNRPRPVTGLGKAEKYTRWEVDMSITLTEDLADHQGRVFARAGTVVNPLAYSRFNKRIVIFDGDDAAQVEFALSEGDELNTLLVLVNGDPLGLMREHGRRFYFDQDSVMVDRFGIRNVPAVVQRSDPVMQVEEIVVGSK